MRNIGCLVVLAVLAVIAWFFRDDIRARLGRDRTSAAAPTTGVVWEPLTPAGAARARRSVAGLGGRSGPVFTNMRPGEVSSYVFEELSKGVLPPSAQNAEAAVIGDQLAIRALINLADFGGKQSVGPIAAMLGDREPVQFGGTIEVIRPGLAQYRVKAIKIRDLSLPPPMIPRILKNIERGPRQAGVAPDGLPLVIPEYIGDVRISNGKVTLYKAVR
ncbi:MAG: hypothetical protein WKG32_03075 [Gemmatimonadaceae bacterium]